jgi:hypothetical protein
MPASLALDRPVRAQWEATEMPAVPMPVAQMEERLQKRLSDEGAAVLLKRGGAISRA